MKFRTATLLSAAALLVLAAVAAPPDFIGTWIGKTEVPDQGVDDITMIIKKTDSGLAGTIVDTMGLIAPETPLAGIKINGNVMTFQFPLVDGATVTNTVKMEGEKLTGSWEHPEGSTGAFVFERKK